jgi:hypothetical protein
MKLHGRGVPVHLRNGKGSVWLEWSRWEVEVRDMVQDYRGWIILVAIQGFWLFLWMKQEALLGFQP